MAKSNGCDVSVLKPVLLFAYGNLSRGDDALGPLLLQQVEDTHCLDGIELLTDFQLQIEHALDLENRTLVLFVDASVAGDEAFDFIELAPSRDDSYTTHAMSPVAVLAVYQAIKKQVPPPCFLLSIKGEAFELGEGLSKPAEQYLAQAGQFVGQLLAEANVDRWRERASRFLLR